ncbi:aromatic acid exporter family protein [Streptococcus himalayensis]|uniref:Membrane protein n=1 Tax=Streptococcus himalayensis TaxID=1888195 RepID=A0A917A462_9STRE|nr:aromatic acid exporter family protein [Streptococcus himalayensis]GGE26104.1 membrane protein [Streptococcus himalayensis]
MPIFQRTIKLALATCLAVWLAHVLHLLYPTAAGSITILSLLDTRRASFKTAWDRLWSTILALIIGMSAFTLLGFNLWALGLYLCIYVPIAYRTNLSAWIPPCTVLVLHFFQEKAINLPLFTNAMCLFFIGAGLALLVNLYMPSQNKKIQEFHRTVELELKTILKEFAHFLGGASTNPQEALIQQLDQTLSEALHIVYLDRHNQVFRQTDYQVHYFEMRQAQNRILREIAESLAHCSFNSQEGKALAEIFQLTAQQLSQTNAGHELLHALTKLWEDFHAWPLPQNRQEFETRAKLYQILHDLEHFVQLKVDFYHRYPKES